MKKQVSFAKYENKVLPGFRQKISAAESTEDVKKFFVYTTQELFDNIFDDNSDFEYDDITLLADTYPHYKLSSRLLASGNFKSAWTDSDLSRVISRLAQTAMNRYKHLEKKPEKTVAKIRM